jgi:hypothetical protein
MSFFQVEDMQGRVCMLSAMRNKFMDEIAGGRWLRAVFRISDTGYVEKLIKQARGEPADDRADLFRYEGRYYRSDILQQSVG